MDTNNTSASQNKKIEGASGFKSMPLPGQALRALENSPFQTVEKFVQRSCHLNTALGEYTANALYYRQGNARLLEHEQTRLQLEQAMLYCDAARNQKLQLGESELQYLFGLLDLTVAQVSFDTGISDYRLIDLVSGEAEASRVENYELADYIYEVAEEAALELKARRIHGNQYAM